MYEILNVHVNMRGEKSFMQYLYLLNHLYHSLRKIMLKSNGTKLHNERKDSIVLLGKMNNPIQGNVAYDGQFSNPVGKKTDQSVYWVTDCAIVKNEDMRNTSTQENSWMPSTGTQMIAFQWIPHSDIFKI